MRRVSPGHLSSAPWRVSRTCQTPPAPAATAAAYTEPIREIEYVRTYTKVAQVQLRAVIDALAEQVDRFGDLPVASADRRDENG